MKILHVTDLHTGWMEEGQKEQAAWERLYREAGAVIQKTQAPDILAVTGDLVMHGTKEEFQRTEGYLNRLRKILGLGKERVFFCCGNHDSDTPQAGSAFNEYEAFVRRFYDGSKPWGQGLVYSVSSCKKTSLARFNDCWLDPKDVDRILEQGRGQERKGVLLMHHQPEMFDSQTEIERLGAAVNVILGGHLHTGYTRQYEWKGMTVVNGIAVTPHLDFLPRGFQMVETDGLGGVETVMYVFRDGKGVWEGRAC